MSANPVCCTRDTTIQDVAKMMVDYDCGVIPIVETKETMRLIGLITDRDIVCRTIAKGIDPLQQMAGDFMSSPVVVAKPDMDLHECLENMERYQIRRLVVVDDNGCCCGVLSQADVVSKLPEHETAEVLRQVSRPSDAASQVKQQKAA